jgi:hypothetical protein
MEFKRVSRKGTLGLLIVLLSPVSATSGDEMQSLFNGRDLSGWVLVNTPPDTWSVQDGMLVCSGKPIGELRTERMYQNFILEVEWRHMVSGGNAGIFVWADDITARGVPFHRSVEVQVLDHGYGQSRSHTTHGDIFPIHGAKMTPLNGRGGDRAFPTEERSNPSPEWNHYRIECFDGAISLAVNGKVVTQGQDASPKKGYICLESEGGIVHYRNLKIQELPDTPIDPADVATEHRGFESLYSGLDLRGWTATDAGLSHWKTADWVLQFDGDAVAADRKLTSSKPADNCEFILDIRPAEGFVSLAVSGIALAAELKPGRWQRLTGSVRDGDLMVAVDGGEPQPAHPVASGTMLQLEPDGPADFANIYWRAIDPQ